MGSWECGCTEPPPPDSFEAPSLSPGTDWECSGCETVERPGIKTAGCSRRHREGTGGKEEHTPWSTATHRPLLLFDDHRSGGCHAVPWFLPFEKRLDLRRHGKRAGNWSLPIYGKQENVWSFWLGWMNGTCLPKSQPRHLSCTGSELADRSYNCPMSFLEFKVAALKGIRGAATYSKRLNRDDFS